MKTATRAAIIGMALMFGAASAQPSLADRLEHADQMITRCLEYATAQKLSPLSVGVVDVSGTLIAFKRQPGAASATADAALLKARTAVRLNAPTALLGQAAAADAAARDTFLVLQMTTIPGGIPFTSAGAELAGAVGVSGAAPDQDAACAQQAVEHVSAQRR